MYPAPSPHLAGEVIRVVSCVLTLMAPGGCLDLQRDEEHHKSNKICGCKVYNEVERVVINILVGGIDDENDDDEQIEDNLEA